MLPRPVAAQTIIGELVDRSTGDPIAGAYVGLLTEQLDTVAETLADGGGRFVLAPSRGTAFLMQVTAFGYRSVLDGIFEVGPADTLWLTARLSLEPIEIEGVEVSTAGQRRDLANAGFYRRLSSGSGTFITPEEIELRAPTMVSDLFVGIPRVSLMSSQNGLSKTLSIRVGGRVCHPNVFLDNLLIYRGQVATGAAVVPLDGDRALSIRSGRSLDIDALVTVENLIAVELFTSPAEIPLQFNSQGSGCGVLLLWTKSGG